MSDIYGTAAALEEIEGELSQVLTFNGSDYPCIIGARNDGSTLGEGGFALSAGLEVVCRRELFATLPDTHDNFTINSKVHKIMSLVLSHDGKAVVFQVEDVNKDS